MEAVPVPDLSGIEGLDFDPMTTDFDPVLDNMDEAADAAETTVEGYHSSAAGMAIAGGYSTVVDTPDSVRASGGGRGGVYAHADYKPLTERDYQQLSDRIDRAKAAHDSMPDWLLGTIAIVGVVGLLMSLLFLAG